MSVVRTAGCIYIWVGSWCFTVADPRRYSPVLSKRFLPGWYE